MAGMAVRLLDSKETDEIFKNDLVFQGIKQRRFNKTLANGNVIDVGITPQCLEVLYQGEANAAFTEIGTAMTAEFNGSAFEKTTVACATAALTPGGSYFTIGVSAASGVETKYAMWFSKYQVQTVVCKTFALTTSGTYFTIYDSEAAPTGYYVWLDKNGDGTTDKPTVATLTECACDISGATTADDVATIVAAAINALAGFGASATTATVTITHATKGSPSADAVDVDTGYTIAKTQNGGVDPLVTGYTSEECDIKAATTADSVGVIVAAVIDALSDVGATNSSGTVTILNTSAFLVEATADGAIATGFTITQVEQSSDPYAGAPLYLVSSDGDDTDLIAKDMRKDTIIGFAKNADGVPVLKSEEVALSGATQVKTTELKWIRAIHHAGSDFGSAGQDAKGNVALENHEGTDYLVIAAGTTESEGGVIWIPDNFHAIVAELDIMLHDITLATAGDGVIVKGTTSGLDPTKNNRIYNTDLDNNVFAIVCTRETPHANIKWPIKTIMHGTDVGKITLAEGAINTAQSFIFRMYIILWYAEN